jgi:hypothetical protein
MNSAVATLERCATVRRRALATYQAAIACCCARRDARNRLWCSRWTPRRTSACGPWTAGESVLLDFGLTTVNRLTELKGHCTGAWLVIDGLTPGQFSIATNRARDIRVHGDIPASRGPPPPDEHNALAPASDRTHGRTTGVLLNGRECGDRRKFQSA